jgi:hypothetical protein
MSSADVVLALAAAFLALPVLGSLIALVRSPRPSGPRAAWDWRLSLDSALAYALAFSIQFFVQELFLVVPKALTPGLKPTLFHNNHDWTGTNPLAELFQGTGALATVVVGLSFMVWVTRRPPRSRGLRLFAIWMALLGLLEALPQVLIGTVIPQNDVGRAMTYLGFPEGVKIGGSVTATVAMALACGLVVPLLLTLAPGSETQDARGRARTILRFAVLPALAAVALIVPFRLPGAPIEILFPPVVATLAAATWLQGWSWIAPRAPADPARPGWSTPILLAALGLLLAVFHLLLRPGVEFF